MCSNLLVRHYYLSCLCLYRLSLCKNKYVSWSTTPIYSVFEAIPKRRFLHQKNLSTSCRRDHLQQQKEVSTLAEGKFLFHSLPCLYACYPNSSAAVFRCLRKERFLHLITEKNVYFALCHTLHHYGPLWIIFALHYIHIVYITALFPYCILSATIFPFPTIFSPSFFCFQVLFSFLYLYIVVLHLFITTLLW